MSTAGLFFLWTTQIIFSLAWSVEPPQTLCARILRDRTLQAELVDRARTYDRHTISPLRVNPLHSEALRPNSANGIAISFGSGGDVLTPMVISPQSAEFHLVDLLNAWGQGPGEVIFEIFRRLNHLAADARVEILNKGFIQFVDPKKLTVPEGVTHWGSGTDVDLREHFQFPREFWTHWGWPDEEHRDPAYLKPLILSVRWTSPSQGPQERKVFVHPLDYEKTSYLDSLDHFLKIPVMDIVLTGAQPPTHLLKYVAKLPPGGRLTIEIFPHFSDLISQLEPLGTVEEMPSAVYQPMNGVGRLMVFTRR